MNEYDEIKSDSLYNEILECELPSPAQPRVKNNMIKTNVLQKQMNNVFKFPQFLTVGENDVQFDT